MRSDKRHLPRPVTLALLAERDQAVAAGAVPPELRSRQRLLTAAALLFLRDRDLPRAVGPRLLRDARQACAGPAAEQPGLNQEERCRQLLPAALAAPRLMCRRMLFVGQPAFRHHGFSALKGEWSHRPHGAESHIEIQVACGRASTACIRIRRPLMTEQFVKGALAVRLGDELERVAAATAVHPVAVRLRRLAWEVE